MSGIIAEIVICDETGNDYDKIMNKYGDFINNNTNFKVYKNDAVLGVFKNKLKVASLASSNYIALIDSDNFCDETYFLNAANYIQNNEKSFSEAVILCPTFAKPNFNYTKLEGKIINKQNVREYVHEGLFHVLMNTGNYILTKKIINNISFDESVLFYTTACDVLYFNLLAFQQFDDFQLHIVKDLEYTHVVHGGSLYMNTINNCSNYRDSILMPIMYNL